MRRSGSPPPGSPSLFSLRKGSYGVYGYAVTYVDCDPQNQKTVEQANLLIKSGNSTNIVNGMYYGSDPTMAYLTPAYGSVYTTPMSYGAYLTPAYGSVYTTPMSYGRVRCKCTTKACKITRIIVGSLFGLFVLVAVACLVCRTKRIVKKVDVVEDVNHDAQNGVNKDN